MGVRDDVPHRRSRLTAITAAVVEADDGTRVEALGDAGGDDVDTGRCPVLGADTCRYRGQPRPSGRLDQAVVPAVIGRPEQLRIGTERAQDLERASDVV